MQWIKRSLSSVLLPDVDVIVIDNGSTDGTIDFIRNHFPDIELICSEKNIGFGAANNIGLRKAFNEKYDFVYLLNQDAWIFPDTLTEMIRASYNNPDFGILSPVQLSGDEKTPDSAFKRGCKKVLDNETHNAIVEVPFVMAAHWFIPLHALKKIGGFSPTFFHYGEDNNYIDRVKYHGYRVGVVTSAKGVHDRADRPLPREKELYLKDISNLIRLSNPNKGLFYNLLTSWFYACAFAIKSHTLSPVKGMARYLMRLKEIIRNRIQSQQVGAFLK